MPRTPATSNRFCRCRSAPVSPSKRLIADYWYKYVGLEGRVIGMTTYGESAPAPALFEEFGFTLENILGQAEELLED